jgi:sugar phosphate permease
MSYLKSGNVSSVSGILDFASYLGAGISSALYGVIIKYFGYEPMFISWGIISIISIFVIGLINKLRKRSHGESEVKA